MIILLALIYFRYIYTWGYDPEYKYLRETIKMEKAYARKQKQIEKIK